MNPNIIKVKKINKRKKVSNYKVKNIKIGLLRNMLKCERDSSVLYKVIHEANIQKGLDHPSILKIFEIFDGPEYVVISEINDGKKLFDEINDFGPFQEKVAANLIYQLLRVVNYLHKNKRLIHSRINPGTIVVNTYDDDNEFYDIKLINYHDVIFLLLFSFSLLIIFISLSLLVSLVLRL